MTMIYVVFPNRNCPKPFRQQVCLPSQSAPIWGRGFCSASGAQRWMEHDPWVTKHAPTQSCSVGFVQSHSVVSELITALGYFALMLKSCSPTRERPWWTDESASTVHWKMQAWLFHTRHFPGLFLSMPHLLMHRLSQNLYITGTYVAISLKGREKPRVLLLTLYEIKVLRCLV